MNKELIKYKNTDDILVDITNIIEQAKNIANASVNYLLLQRNYLLGKRIIQIKSSNDNINNFDTTLLKISKYLTMKYSGGFDITNLHYFVEFYQVYPDIFDRENRSLLTWTHYRILLQINEKDERDWYEKEAIDCSWSVRTLQRNISSDYYHRLLLSQNKELVREEMLELTDPLQEKKLEFVKNPVILEFLGLSEDNSFKESDIEKSIIAHLQKFLLELGKGYTFVGRQYRIHTEKEDYYIDLVFFNYILNCFVLIDLKTSKISHKDIGQMDMYIRMYDELHKEDYHNPTLGIILCQDTDEDIAKYSILKGNEQLFATKYKLYLPTDEELKAEIESQKALYYLQHNIKK